jgi:hypothetical protein
MDSTDDPYPRPIATVDLAIFALADTGLEVLLVQHLAEPSAGAWALPGGLSMSTRIRMSRPQQNGFSGIRQALKLLISNSCRL